MENKPKPCTLGLFFVYHSGDCDFWPMNSWENLVSKLPTCTHYQAEHQSRNHLFLFCTFLFLNMCYCLWFMKFSSWKQNKQTSRSLSKRRAEPPCISTIKSSLIILYIKTKTKKNPKMNQQNYRNGCRVVKLVICDSKRPLRATLNYIWS